MVLLTGNDVDDRINGSTKRTITQERWTPNNFPSCVRVVIFWRLIARFFLDK